MNHKQIYNLLAYFVHKKLNKNTNYSVGLIKNTIRMKIIIWILTRRKDNKNIKLFIKRKKKKNCSGLMNFTTSKHTINLFFINHVL